MKKQRKKLGLDAFRIARLTGGISKIRGGNNNNNTRNNASSNCEPQSNTTVNTTVYQTEPSSIPCIEDSETNDCGPGGIG
ncbi:MAG: hypothetical protein ACI9Y7_002691 [Dokdonia sp.]|jgi:hypothetical protein